VSVLLSSADIVGLAVQTEQSGEAFYRQAQARAQDADAQKLFAYLADEEMRHRALFDSLEPEALIVPSAVIDWEQETAYIRATVAREFFGATAPIRAISDKASTHDMIGQAIAFERQTLLFFYELRDLAVATSADIITRIIQEEKAHVRSLSRMLKEQSPPG